MRIAILTNNRMPPQEGIGRHIKECARRLVARGHEPIILARGQDRREWHSQISEGILIKHYPYLGIRPFQHEVSRRAIQKWLDDGANGCSLLHVHLPLMPAFRTDLPIVATFHSPMLTDTAAITEPGLKARLIKSNAHWFSRRKEQWYIKNAERLIAVSAGVREELLTHYDCAGRPIEVIENGVDHEFFMPDPSIRREPLVLYVGRLGYRKGLFRLLEAFSLIAHRPIGSFARLKLQLIGEGPLRAAILKRATELGIADRVELLGFQDRNAIRTALRRAACFVNPADYESGPLTMLEALACETPVVSTRTGLAAGFDDSMPVWHCSTSSESLARQIELSVGEQQQASAMAARCRSAIVERFGWDRAVESLSGVLSTDKAMAA